MTNTTKKIAITDVVLRDAHQSLFATRLRLDDMLPIAAELDKIGFWSLEAWGGATFDSCIRFLGEDPWVRSEYAVTNVTTWTEFIRVSSLCRRCC